MKMTFGSTATISDYQSFVYNYTMGQFNYKIPNGGLAALQLYIPLAEQGMGVPGAATYELIHTCGATIGTIETLTPANYVAGIDANGEAYMVITGFNESTTAPCWVIGVTLDGSIWFSQEYSNDGCGGKGLNFVTSCYGNLDPKISFDTEGIYFGQSQGGTTGDATVVYQHYFPMRTLELTIQGIRNEFKQGRTRTFRTESVALYLFWGELIPEWYLKHIDAVFKRGEVTVIYYHDVYSFDATDVLNGQPNPPKYLVESTNYEKANDCPASWKPSVVLKENFYNSFSCEPDPCTVVSQSGGGGGTTVCCDPTVNNATVTPNGEGGQSVCVNFNTCSPAPVNGYQIYYRISGSGGSYILAGTGFTSSPACFGTADPDGTNYEGYIQSDCGGDGLGGIVSWSTGAASTYSIVNQIVCSGGGGLFSNFLISGGTPGDIVTVRFTYGGAMQKVGTASFTRADLTTDAPLDGMGLIITSTSCWTDTGLHGFDDPTHGNPGSLVQTRTFAMTGTTTNVTSIAVVNNSSDSFNSLFVEVIDVNGSAVAGVGTVGCDGNSGTGGTC